MTAQTGSYLERNRIMGQYKNEWGEISQIIDEHVNLMMGRYLETGCVFKCISAKIGFFPYAQCLGKVLMDKDWNRLNNLIYQEHVSEVCVL